jgi:hypothetical protein
MLKSLTNIGEQLTEIEAKTFKDNMKINEEGLFDYNGTEKKPKLLKFSSCFYLLEFFLKFTQPPKPKSKKKGKKKKKKNK